MKTVASMIDALGNDKIKFMEFTRKYSKNTDMPICFFEGKSARYKPERIEKKVGSKKWVPIEYKRKKDVYEINNLIKKSKTYRNVQTEFFVNPDYERPLGDNELSIDEIKIRYAHQWVCVVEIKWNSQNEPVKGFVIANDIRQETLIEKIRKFHVRKPSAIIYTFYADPLSEEAI
ncbi:MAG: hypothetical protein GY795_10505 [Desulfobacterales bacterium]|nr:hypothetical protein [Desulfobacterales bacterium]